MLRSGRCRKNALTKLCCVNTFESLVMAVDGAIENIGIAAAGDYELRGGIDWIADVESGAWRSVGADSGAGRGEKERLTDHRIGNLGKSSSEMV
jgi:hypothetical protein